MFIKNKKQVITNLIFLKIEIKKKKMLKWYNFVMDCDVFLIHD